MTAAETPELIAPERGLDASSASYPLVVHAVVLAPLEAEPENLPSEAVQLSARTLGALNEVAFWANDGQSADPTACAWLSYLRWAVACGAQLPSDAPHPPPGDFDHDHPVLAGPGPHPGDSFTALATGALGEVVRPVLPLAGSPEVLARTAPYGLVPTIGWKSLVALAVDSAAITHGSPEAQTAAAAMALSVHAAARAAQIAGARATIGHVVAETARVCALITRPAPLTTDLLARCSDRSERDRLLSTAATETLTVEPEHAASYALALGCAALLAAEEDSADPSGHDAARRAHERLPGSSSLIRAARTVSTTVAAARWPRPEEEEHLHLLGTTDDRAVPPEPAAARTELKQLAEEWNSRWRP